MANISKINFKGVEYDIKPLMDSTPTQGSTNAVSSGGVYDEITSLRSDFTKLTTATSADVGKALKAKTVTNGKVTEWEFGKAGGLSDASIEALLNCFRHVAWTDGDGQTYYDALENALNDDGDPLASISATFDNSIIYTSDTLDYLKNHLDVTATYSDGRGTITLLPEQYALSGSLTIGNPVITVSFGTKSTTFTPTVYGFVFTKGYTNGIGTVSEYTPLRLNTNRNRIAGDTTIGDQPIMLGTVSVSELYPIPIRSGITSITINAESCQTNWQIVRWLDNQTDYDRVSSSLWESEQVADVSSYNDGSYFITINAKTVPEGEVTNVDVTNWSVGFA